MRFLAWVGGLARESSHEPKKAFNLPTSALKARHLRSSTFFERRLPEQTVGWFTLGLKKLKKIDLLNFHGSMVVIDTLYRIQARVSPSREV